MLPQHKIIFEPMNIGKIQLDNRVALAPTHVGMGDDRGMVTDQEKWGQTLISD
jgi:2,4-dienoyl-CoA reductase-like NADH-dependent reductase (Old Yellow Enzyme family)